jgi:hypothetical protein
VQGGIAQTAGLVLAANARLRGLPARSGWPDGSTWIFCREVRFDGRERPGLLGRRPVTAADPDQWLATLPAGATHAQLQVFARNHGPPDRQGVAFANGGPVFLAQLLGRTTESWYGEWRVTDQTAADRRIWSVAYRQVPDMPTELPARTRGDVRERLEAVLGEALAFSRRHGLAFSGSFEAAVEALDAVDPLIDAPHADLVPEGLLPLAARRLFAAAGRAWVFGGMGSWNDLVFDGGEQASYDALSDRLFWTVIDALVAATNASAPAVVAR